MPAATAIKLQTLLSLLTIAGLIIAGFLFIEPVRDVSGMKDKLEEVRDTQLVQTEALKTLAEVAKDSKDMRREVDRNRADIDNIRRRLDRLPQ